MAAAPNMYKPKRHIVIDVETLHTRRNAAIIDIAAVVVDLNNSANHGAEFSIQIRPSAYDAMTDTEFASNQDTVAFHHKNDPEFIPFCEAHGVSLQEAAQQFCEWIRTWSDSVELHLWSQGKDFDFPILENMIHQTGETIPWAKSRVHCLRDAVWLNPASRIKTSEPVAHKALPDARFEAKQLQVLIGGSSWYQRLFK